MSIEYNTLHIAVVAGGASSEHDVSLQSANTIYNALQNMSSFVYPLYLDRTNQWFLLDSNDPNPYSHIKRSNPINLIKNGQILEIHREHDNSILGSVDLFFPALHGRYGEDGSIQGLFELWNIPYVGSGVKASAVAMDKEFTKIILSTADIPTLPHFILHKKEKLLAPMFTELCEVFKVHALFVKPASTGSSVGVTKVESPAKWQQALDLAFTHDNKLLVEPAMKVREIEIAVLDNAKEIKASLAGEISYNQGFYDYEQKYTSDSKVELKIPTVIEQGLLSKIQQFAIKAHQQLECGGLSRVDFFLVEDNVLYINEINTMPGFTNKSMYPMLWQASGISMDALMKDLIQYALRKHDL